MQYSRVFVDLAIMGYEPLYHALRVWGGGGGRFLFFFLQLARRQRIVPREELLMQKNSRSAFESVSVRCNNGSV